MSQPLFDEAVRALRQQRARKQGPVLFLAERACEDLMERLSLVQRRFDRALVIGLPDPDWTERFRPVAEHMTALATIEELVAVEPGQHDLCIILGQLDTTNDLPLFLRVIRAALGDDAHLIGAFPGNNSLPVLREAMLAADRITAGGVSPRVHPRIEASAFAGLLHEAGFTMPVVDIDRVRLRYRSFDDLVTDLRGMAASNALLRRSRRPPGRAALSAARQAFASAGTDDGTVETIEMVQFAAWTDATRPAW